VRTYKPRKPKARRGRMLRAVQLRAEGQSLREIARVLEVSHDTVWRDLRQWDKETATVTNLSDRSLGMTRSAAARLAAHESWANTPDRSARAAKGYTGLLARFEREARERLGPDASDRAVADSAESARKAYYSRLAAAGVKARRAAS
jgi:hypothetical protein